MLRLGKEHHIALLYDLIKHVWLLDRFPVCSPRDDPWSDVLLMRSEMGFEKSSMGVCVVVHPEHILPLRIGKHQPPELEQTYTPRTDDSNMFLHIPGDLWFRDSPQIPINAQHNLELKIWMLCREMHEACAKSLGASIGWDEHTQFHRFQYTVVKLIQRPESGRYLLT